jgi:hypothetical protein
MPWQTCRRTARLPLFTGHCRRSVSLSWRKSALPPRPSRFGPWSSVGTGRSPQMEGRTVDRGGARRRSGSRITDVANTAGVTSWRRFTFRRRNPRHPLPCAPVRRLGRPAACPWWARSRGTCAYGREILTILTLAITTTGLVGRPPAHGRRERVADRCAGGPAPRPPPIPWCIDGGLRQSRGNKETDLGSRCGKKA